MSFSSNRSQGTTPAVSCPETPFFPKHQERPIIFSGQMVRAILEGRKTQTRRVIKHQGLPLAAFAFYEVDGDEIRTENDQRLKCPHGTPGDHLWVRETWNYTRDLTPEEQIKQDAVLGRFKSGAVTDIVSEALSLPVASGEKRAMYAADYGDWAHNVDSDLTWRSSMFMPHWASRLTLEITEIRVQRLQEISKDDAKAEGWGGYLDSAIAGDPYIGNSPRTWYHKLWDSLNAKRPECSWKDDPWVWVISFQREEGVSKGQETAQVSSP